MSCDLTSTQTITGSKTFTNVKSLFATTKKYSNGSVSQSDYVITGINTNFAPEMQGGIIRFDNGVTAFVISVTSTTSLLSTVSQLLTSQNYVLYYGGSQLDNLGNAALRRLFISCEDKNSKALVINAAKNQVSSLQEWQNNAQIAQALINKDGNFDTKNLSNSYHIKGQAVVAMPNETSILLGNTGNTGLHLSSQVLSDNGKNNTLIGVNAGKNVNVSNDNTLIGFNAGTALVGATSNLNTMVGANAGYQSKGKGNAIFGCRAGGQLAAGDYNCIFGEQALDSNGLYVGNNNVVVGAKTRLSGTNVSNATVLGYGSSSGDGGVALGPGAIAPANTLVVKAGNVTVLTADNTGLKLPYGTSTLQLGSNVMTFPTSSDTIVGAESELSLSNKTMTHVSNNVNARGLWCGNGQTLVSTYASSAPKVGHILRATSDSSATWQNNVGMTWRNTWINNVNYGRNDVVTHKGTCWECIASNINQMPPHADYWNKIVSSFGWKGPWSNLTSYVANDIVTHEGLNYICLADCLGIVVTNGGYWDVFNAVTTVYLHANGTDEVVRVYAAEDAVVIGVTPTVAGTYDVMFEASCEQSEVLQVVWSIYVNGVQRLTSVRSAALIRDIISWTNGSIEVRCRVLSQSGTYTIRGRSLTAVRLT
jgi:hypothetical protein